MSWVNRRVGQHDTNDVRAPIILYKSTPFPIPRVGRCQDIALRIFIRYRVSHFRKERTKPRIEITTTGRCVYYWTYIANIRPISVSFVGLVGFRLDICPKSSFFYLANLIGHSSQLAYWKCLAPVAYRVGPGQDLTLHLRCGAWTSRNFVRTAKHRKHKSAPWYYSNRCRPSQSGAVYEAGGAKSSELPSPHWGKPRSTPSLGGGMRMCELCRSVIHRASALEWIWVRDRRPGHSFIHSLLAESCKIYDHMK